MDPYFRPARGRSEGSDPVVAAVHRGRLGVAWRGVAWRGVAWRGVAWGKGDVLHCSLLFGT